MAYTPNAIALRRCQATTRVGARCRCWACWDDPDQLCSTHAGRTAANWERFIERHKAVMAALEAGASHEQLARLAGWGGVQHAAYPPCRCKAYAWPHRPGGGDCPWPDVPGGPEAPDEAELLDEPFVEPDRYPRGVIAG